MTYPDVKYFFHITSQTSRFSKKIHFQYVLIFSTTLSETFFILRKTEQDVIINTIYIGLYVKYRYDCQILKNLELSLQIAERYSNLQIHKIFVLWEPCCSMRTDRQIDVTKLIGTFRNFAKAPNKVFGKIYIYICIISDTVFIKIDTFVDAFVFTGMYYLKLLYLVLVFHVSICHIIHIHKHTYTYHASYITLHYSSCQNSRVV